uniref:Uncharacterized protein n=1 Tax=Oryza brachyantha TaxID=4533 RepID=J3KZH0_ORYBR
NAAPSRDPSNRGLEYLALASEIPKFDRMKHLLVPIGGHRNSSSNMLCHSGTGCFNLGIILSCVYLSYG